MTVQYAVISAWLARWETHFVEPVVFGTTDAQQIAVLLDGFCREELGAPVAEYLFYESSQGAVCGVRLEDGRRVVLKIHQPSRSLAFLQSIIQAQRFLVQQGYPCPAQLLEPRPLASGLVTVEELIDEGVYHHAHNPAIRRSMAHMLAWLVKLTWTPEAIPGVRPEALDLRVPASAIWPPPHSKLFDFEATARGAEWIDELAHAALEIKRQGAGRLVLGHQDWSVKHLRYIDERVRVIYDWDSLTLEKEPVIVGQASIHFTYTETFPEAHAPSAAESQAFIAEYEAARGTPFTPAEQRTLQAATLYGLAYGARCEHALAPANPPYPPGSSRDQLARFL